MLIGAYSGDERFRTDSDCLHDLYSNASTLRVARKAEYTLDSGCRVARKKKTSVDKVREERD